MNLRHAALAALGVAFLGPACNRAPAGPAGPAAFPPAAVQLETAHTTAIEDASEYVATVKSMRSTAVQPQIDGQITQIFVKSGDRVARGARLMQIDPERQQAAVTSQEADRSAREADVEFAKQQHQRAEELFRAGAVSRQELEAAETGLSAAEGRLQSLSAQVQQQQVQLQYFTITSPTAGVVGDVPVRVGNQVSPQTVLTTIDQNASLEVYVQVPIERAAALEIGLPIRILNSDGSETIATTAVSFISPSADEQTQSVLVKGLVPNPTGALRASQYVRARIVWKKGEGLVVPVTAVVRINGQHFAFVAAESAGADGSPGLVAKQRAIKVGPIVGDSYTVLDGLAAGDRIVVAGAQRLADGVPIAPAP
ncbi:MAG: efflux RND transporter periplasmic adaptor subunit [Luteitalea sp.]|nr:efflux RND transporter periplasmic adaptor subunit [Luteitalea sp.]